MTHDSVLLKEAVEALEIIPQDIVVDGTVGGAGHFKAILGTLSKDGVLVGIDADSEAVARGKEVARGSEATVHLVEGNFRDLERHLDGLQIEKVHKVLFDLGWSAYHLSSGRGFSFRVDEPLLMTYGEAEQGKTAADVINSATEETISEILHTLGEERFARPIARGIVKARGRERILTTSKLVDVILESTPSWYHTRRIHPATKTFQALRLYVNDELGALREGLTGAVNRLSSKGRIAVITFHSLEDRIVKNFFRDAAHEGVGTVITKKPIEPSSEELAHNPRARSAKLRVFERNGAHSKITNPYTAYAYA